MFKFKLDSRKAIEAVGILAGKSPYHRIGSKRLLALLYIASRECLKRSGRPLLGGRLVAMQHGPVHGDVFSLIKEEKGAEGREEWAKHFHLVGYNVVLDKDPGQNALSRFEVGILNEVLEKHEDIETWDIAHSMHNFFEYRRAYQKGRGRLITLEQIIEGVQRRSMAKSIIRDLKEKDEIDELFASAKRPVR